MEVFHTGMKTKLLKFVCVWQIYAGGIQLSLRWWLLQKPGTSEIQILERIVLHPCNKKKKSCVGPTSFFPTWATNIFHLCVASQKKPNKPDILLKVSIWTEHHILWKLQWSLGVLSPVLKNFLRAWRMPWGQCNFPKFFLWGWTSSKAVWRQLYFKANV